MRGNFSLQRLSLGCNGPARFIAPFVVVFAFLISSQAQKQTSLTPAAADPTAQVAVGPTDPTTLIGTGDLITVDLFNTPELSGKFRVGQFGDINLPQGGVVHVGGLTPTEASRAIEARLRQTSIMLDPHATVLVAEYGSQNVVVLGEVKNPGRYSLLGDSSLYGALAAAGGPTANEGSSITISHQGNSAPNQVLLVSSANYSERQHATVVQPGDTVFVSQATRVYVLGDVGRPGTVSMPNGVALNVLQALSLAEGLNRTAKLTKASIVRQTGEGVVTIPINVKNIMQNKEADPVLQASDIIVVPRSDSKAFFDTAVPGATAAILGSIFTALIIR